MLFGGHMPISGEGRGQFRVEMLQRGQRDALEQGFQSLVFPVIQRGNPQLHDLTMVMKQ